MERVVLHARLQRVALGTTGREVLVRLGVPAPGAALDQRGTGAAARAMDRFLGNAPYGHDVVAVNRDAGETVGLGAVAQVSVSPENIGCTGRALRAVLDHENNGQSLAGGNAGGFVPEAKSGKAVIGHGHYDVRIFLPAVG